MEKKWLGALFVVGCATAGGSTGAQSSNGVPAAGKFCLISEPKRWQSAPRDFSRSVTLQAIGSFEEAAKADRERFHAGKPNEVGHTIDELYVSYTPPTLHL